MSNSVNMNGTVDAEEELKKMNAILSRVLLIEQQLATPPVNEIGDNLPVGTVIQVDVSAYSSKIAFATANPDWYICDGTVINKPGSVYDGQSLNMAGEHLRGAGVADIFNGIDSTVSLGSSGNSNITLTTNQIPSGLQVSGTSSFAIEEYRGSGVPVWGSGQCFYGTMTGGSSSRGLAYLDGSTTVTARC